MAFFKPNEPQTYYCATVVTSGPHLLKAVVQQRELLVAAHDGRGERVLGEAAPRLFLHEHELPPAFLVAVVRQAAHRVAVALVFLLLATFTFIVCVFPIIVIVITTITTTAVDVRTDSYDWKN